MTTPTNPPADETTTPSEDNVPSLAPALTLADLDVIEARAEMATEGPWEVPWPPKTLTTVSALQAEDAAFIAAAREATRRADERIAELEDGIEIAAKLGNEAIAERAAKMRARLNELRVRESEQKTQLDKILPSYRAVSDEYQSALAQKNKWLGEEAQHSAMCESGCQNDICPTGF
jgi:hypothetical protein